MAKTPKSSPSDDDAKLELPELSLGFKRRKKKQQPESGRAPEPAASAPDSAAPAPEPAARPVGSKPPRPGSRPPASVTARPTESQPTESQPSESQPSESQPSESQPTGSRSEEIRSEEIVGTGPTTETPETPETNKPEQPEAEQAETEQSEQPEAEQSEAEQPEQPEPVAARSAEPDEPPKSPLTLPEVPGRIAALLTGLAVGLVSVILVFGGTQGCAVIRGSESCGGVGIFLFIAVLALGVLLGTKLLDAWDQSDTLSTSFLGVGLLAVLTMLFLLDFVDSWWMVIVIPLLSMVTFVFSWWATTKFVQENPLDDPAAGEAHR